jgi:predicted nuclease with TOPRIM domain
MNVSKQSLIESGKHYLGVLEEEKNHFYSSLSNNAKVKLDEKNQEITDIQKSLEEDKVKLEALRNTIMKNEQRKNLLTEELKQADQKLTSVKSAFNTAFMSLSEKLKSDLTKIDKYL